MRLRTVLFVTGLVICFVSFGFAVSEASAGSGQGVEAAVLSSAPSHRLMIVSVWPVTTKRVLVWNWIVVKPCH